MSFGSELMLLVVAIARSWHAPRQRIELLSPYDKDFGELAFRFGLPATSGIILFRIPLSSPKRIAEIVLAVLATPIDWVGNFAVIEADRVRLKPLPNIP